jgi:hypothetical protein
MGVLNNVMKSSLVQRHNHTFTKLLSNQSYATETNHGQQENISTELQLMKSNSCEGQQVIPNSIIKERGHLKLEIKSLTN